MERKTNAPGPPNPPPDLKPYHCGWHGQLVKTCRGCGRRFSKKGGDWELNPCPDCGTDRYCRGHVVTGYKKCRFHGAGSALAGRPGGRPRSSGGKFSKALQGTGYLEDYETLLQDDEYMRLKEFIALVDSRLLELARRIESHDSTAAWNSLEHHYQAVKTQQEQQRNALAGLIRAMNAKDKDGVKKRIDQLAELAQDEEPVRNLGLLIKEGKADWANWNDFLGTLEQRRKLSDSDRRLMTDMHQMLTLQQAMDLFTVIVADIREVVGDGEQLTAIGNRIVRRLSDKDERIRQLPFVVQASAEEVAEARP